MGSNFLVTAFVPAMGFVLFSLFAFQPVIPISILKHLGLSKLSDLNFDNIGSFVTITVLFTTILGFILYSLSTYIYKSFEGYTFFLSVNTEFRRKLIRRQKQRAKKIMLETEIVDREIRKLENQLYENKPPNSNQTSWQKKVRERKEKHWETLISRKYALTAYYQSNFPPLDLILPTRFGNILRAAEVYSGRYGIDSVPIWNRLAHTMPVSGMEKVDEANNQCLFLLNCCLLTVLFACSSFLVSGYQSLLLILARENWTELLYFIPINLNLNIYQQRIAIYVVLGLSALLISRLLYEASLLNVGHYGNMIRSSFDLYRFGLLEALHIPLPKELTDEREAWKKLSEFFVGGIALGPVKITYTHPNKPTNLPQEEK